MWQLLSGVLRSCSTHIGAMWDSSGVPAVQLQSGAWLAITLGHSSAKVAAIAASAHVPSVMASRLPSQCHTVMAGHCCTLASCNVHPINLFKVEL